MCTIDNSPMERNFNWEFLLTASTSPVNSCWMLVSYLLLSQSCYLSCPLLDVENYLFNDILISDSKLTAPLAQIVRSSDSTEQVYTLIILTLGKVEAAICKVPYQPGLSSKTVSKKVFCLNLRAY